MDGILLVVKLKGPRRELVADVVEMLGREKILGVIVNWIDEWSEGYKGYGKYGGYNSYYGEKTKAK